MLPCSGARAEAGLRQYSERLIEDGRLSVPEMFQPLTAWRAGAVPIHARTDSGDFRRPFECVVDKRDRLSRHARPASARAVLYNAAEKLTAKTITRGLMKFSKSDMEGNLPDSGVGCNI